MVLKMVERCKNCDSILLVEESDLNIDINYDIYYVCPICLIKNLLSNKKMLINKLKKIKVRMNSIYDKIYLVN